MAFSEKDEDARVLGNEAHSTAAKRLRDEGIKKIPDKIKKKMPEKSKFGQKNN